MEATVSSLGKLPVQISRGFPLCLWVIAIMTASKAIRAEEFSVEFALSGAASG